LPVFSVFFMFVTTQNCSKIQSVRAAAVLTNSYVPGAVIDTSLQNEIILYISFTKGSLTSAEIKAEFSYDGVNYFQETSRSIVGGTSTDTLLEHTYGASGPYVLDLPVMCNYVRFSAKGTGTVTNSSMTLDALVGTV